MDLNLGVGHICWGQRSSLICGLDFIYGVCLAGLLVCICLSGCVRVCVCVCVREYVPVRTCAFAHVLVLPKSLCSLHTVAVHSHFPPFVFPAMQIAMSKGRRLFVSDQLRLPPLPLPLLDSLSLKSTPGEQVRGSKPRCRSHMLGPAFESHLRLRFYIRCLFGWSVGLHILAWLRACVAEYVPARTCAFAYVFCPT